ncbi:sister chromatid cohesion protein PDS5 homolog C-like isoform X2 [Carex rostrata]
MTIWRCQLALDSPLTVFLQTRSEDAMEDKYLVKKIQEIGGKLDSSLPAEELLLQLDEMERLLAEVNQSPSTEVLTGLQPLMSALTERRMLSHNMTDVWVSVLVCICEVIRITAPNNPYTDDTMRFAFERMVESFERIDDLKSRSYRKRVSILESLAEVRSCIIMLDLGLDDLILEMFQCFLRRISLQHSQNVFHFMEKIMTVVITESEIEEISDKLVSCLLLSVRRERMVHLSVSFTLAERVIRKCASKLRPLLRALVGDRADEYSLFVVSLCQEISDAMEQCDANASSGNESERHISERVVSDERPQETADAVEHGLEVECRDETGSAGLSRGTEIPEEALSGGLNREAPAPPVVDRNGEFIEGNLPSIEQKLKRPARIITKTHKAKEAEEIATLLAGLNKRKAVPKKAVKGASALLIQVSPVEAAIVGHSTGSKENWCPEEMVHKRIKVWWPMDRLYYNGTIQKYYRSQKKHLVAYDDGDFEYLHLKDEVWELLEEVDEASTARK